MLKGKARSRSWLASKVELWREAVHESQCIPEAVVEAFTHALLVVSSLLLSGVGQYRRCVCECKSSNEVKWLFVAYREPLQPHLPISKFPVWNLELWQITPGNNLAQAEDQSAHSLGRLLAGICASLLNSRLQHSNQSSPSRSHAQSGVHVCTETTHSTPCGAIASYQSPSRCIHRYLSCILHQTYRMYMFGKVE